MYDDISGMDIIRGLCTPFIPDPDSSFTETIEVILNLVKVNGRRRGLKGLIIFLGSLCLKIAFFIFLWAKVYELEGEKLLSNQELSDVSITDMCSTDDFLWFANYMSQKPLGRFDGERLSFLSSTQLSTTTPIYIAESSENVLWIRNSSTERFGVTAFDPSKNLIWQAKSSSGIPSKAVNDIEVNRDDELWMATKLGLAYFSDASLISEGKAGLHPLF